MPGVVEEKELRFCLRLNIQRLVIFALWLIVPEHILGLSLFILPFDSVMSADAQQPSSVSQPGGQAEDALRDDEVDSLAPPAPAQVPFTVYRDLGVAALEERQYAQARDHFMVALELNPQDPTLLYQLGIVEFNLGNIAAGRRRLRHAHYGKSRTVEENIAEIRTEGEYDFIPLNKDDWDLLLKEHPVDDPYPLRTYPLDVNSIYTIDVSKMEFEEEHPSRSKYLISIPIGLLLVWVFSR